MNFQSFGTPPAEVGDSLRAIAGAIEKFTDEAAWAEHRDELERALQRLQHHFEAVRPVALLCSALRQALEAAGLRGSFDASDLAHLRFGLECLLRDARKAALESGSAAGSRELARAARASEADPRLRDLLLAALDDHAIVSVANERGDIIYVNQRFAEASGYRADELIGRNHRIVKSGSHPPEFYEALWRTITDGRIWRGEICNRRKDGSTYWVSASIMPFLGKRAEDTRYVSIRTNITDVKRLEQEARQASKAKSEFLSSMSHELRTPMNAILGFAQILLFDDGLNVEQQDSVKEIAKAGQHLLSLIDDVLDLARIESGRIQLSIEAVPLWELLAECRDLMVPIAEKRGITLKLPECGGHAVSADRVRLKQALLNLISNAIKYNREQGSVHISVSGLETTGLRIAVTDTGRGVADSKKPMLFQPFNRLGAESSEIEGTGIGLSIVRSLVTKMGGSVGMESDEGVGSTFWIELPRAADVEPGDGDDARNGSVGNGGASDHKHTVLYVEDNPTNLRLVSQILAKREHVHLITAHEPLLGLELAATHVPELILLDIHMPNLDGYQVLERLRADPALSHIPVVAVTASAMPGDLERGRRAGFDDYLTKPVNIARLLALVDALK